jgi:ribonuclease P protein component
VPFGACRQGLMPGLPPRLTRRAEFLRAASRGRKAARPGLVLQALAQPGAPLRVGFTATKKLGGAVVRNRSKRRLREAIRLTVGETPITGYDLVLIAREATATRPWDQLLGDLRGALRQVGVVPGGAPGNAMPGSAPSDVVPGSVS